MDIDCDGVRQEPNNGRCGTNPSDQSTTSFRSRVQGYDAGIVDLDPYRHSFVVFGNTGTKDGYVNFSPRDHGVNPLSVMVALTANSMVSPFPSLLVIGSSAPRAIANENHPPPRLRHG